MKNVLVWVILASLSIHVWSAGHWRVQDRVHFHLLGSAHDDSAHTDDDHEHRRGHVPTADHRHDHGHDHEYGHGHDHGPDRPQDHDRNDVVYLVSAQVESDSNDRLIRPHPSLSLAHALPGDRETELPETVGIVPGPFAQRFPETRNPPPPRRPPRS